MSRTDTATAAAAAAADGAPSLPNTGPGLSRIIGINKLYLKSFILYYIHSGKLIRLK